MKPKIVFLIFFLIISGTALLYTALLPDYSGHHPIWEPAAKPNRLKSFTKKNSPAQSVSEESGGIVSYILKYEPDSDRVILITCHKDGSRIISDIESIKPNYLEAEDVRLLTEGIELADKEAMLILIEDYSS